MSVGQLRQLARACGVQAAYYDVDKKQQMVPAEGLLGILQALGVRIEKTADVPVALRRQAIAEWDRVIEPVIVAEEQLTVRLRIRRDMTGRPFRAVLDLEGGEARHSEGILDDLSPVGADRIEGVDYVVKRLAIGGPLPVGYHRLTLETGEQVFKSLVIRAPQRVFDLWTEDRRRGWGVFLPLYALHSERSWGCGDLTDLEHLAEWTAQQGGHIAATLPLLASFWEQTEDYSPYSPASRLFWNEFYLDINRLAGFESCSAAKSLCEAKETRQTIKQMRSDRFLDYDRFVKLKGRVLRTLSAHFFSQDTAHRADLDQFITRRPEVLTYARFRAACERHGVPWEKWPQRLQAGDLREGDYDQAACQHHLYVQWQLAEQLGSVARRAGERGSLWYLDLPLGVSGAGYDTWMERDTFALSADGGAPPDAFFAAGQNWCFPPMHPEGLRRTGYRYLISVLRQHFQYAKLLRIDHAACIHRMFWIPRGMEATHGAYVHYPAREWYAILALESHRAAAGVVGEDLGTVPRYITRDLRRHGIQSMYVLPFEIEPERKPAVKPPGALSLACLNTHDLAPFAAFWKGEDIDERDRLGLSADDSREQARRERERLRSALVETLQRNGVLEEGESDVEHVLEACLTFLARSRAELLLVNLEDLWFETEPQNMPGTTTQHPNWQHKAALSFERFAADRLVSRILDTVRRSRE